MTESASPAAALRIVGISKSYGPTKVLSDITFDVCKGRVHALVGENGAGKSTLVKIITGVVAADSGEVLVGTRAARFQNSERCASCWRLGRVPGSKAVPPSRCGREHFHWQLSSDSVRNGQSQDHVRASSRSVARARPGFLDPFSLVAGLSMAELQVCRGGSRPFDRRSTAYPRRTDLRLDARREFQAV